MENRDNASGLWSGFHHTHIGIDSAQTQSGEFPDKTQSQTYRCKQRPLHERGSMWGRAAACGAVRRVPHSTQVQVQMQSRRASMTPTPTAV